MRVGARDLIGGGVVITDSDHRPVHPPANTPRRFANYCRHQCLTTRW